MYAIIKSGGKQYRVSVDTTLKVEKLGKDIGETVELNQVLMIANDNKVTIGQPVIQNAKVVAEIISLGRAKKINILKFKRRKHHMKRMGHRQWYNEIKIKAIEHEEHEYGT